MGLDRHSRAPQSKGRGGYAVRAILPRPERRLVAHRGSSPMHEVRRKVGIAQNSPARKDEAGTAEDSGDHASQEASWLPLRREKCHRLLIEGNEGFPAKPIAFVGNDAIGKITARVEHQQAGLHGGPVHFHVGGGQ